MFYEICWSNMTVPEQLDYLFDRVEKLEEGGGIPDLTEVKQDILTLQQSQAATTADINRIKARLDTVEKSVQNMSSELSEQSGKIEANTQAIQGIQTAQGEQDGKIRANTEAIETKSPKLTAGDNVMLTPQTDGTIRVSATGGGEAPAITLDDEVTEDSANGVKSSGIYRAIEAAKTEAKAATDGLKTVVDEHTADLTAIDADVLQLQQTQEAADKRISGLETDRTTQAGQIATLTQHQAEQDEDLSQLTNKQNTQEQTIQGIQTAQGEQDGKIQANTEAIETKSPKLTAGDNVTLTPQEDGTVQVSAAGGAGVKSVSVDSSTPVPPSIWADTDDDGNVVLSSRRLISNAGLEFTNVGVKATAVVKPSFNFYARQVRIDIDAFGPFPAEQRNYIACALGSNQVGYIDGIVTSNELRTTKELIPAGTVYNVRIALKWEGLTEIAAIGLLKIPIPRVIFGGLTSSYSVNGKRTVFPYFIGIPELESIAYDDLADGTAFAVYTTTVTKVIKDIPANSGVMYCIQF